MKSTIARSTIDQAGRFVIPRDLRQAACLEPGMALEVRVDDGAIVIEPAPMAVRLQRRGRFVVAEPARPAPGLTARAVEETRERLRSERGTPRGTKRI